MRLLSALRDNHKHLLFVFQGKILRAILLGVVILSAYTYAHQTFESLPRAHMIAMGREEKPYVYRAFVPWLARLLVNSGLPADTAFTVVIILSAVGLVYGIKYLLGSFLERSDGSDLRGFLAAVVAVEIFIKIFFLENKVYDLTTAMFFAFSLGFLARGKLSAFYLLYPLGCLNRETMFLLSIFFMVYFLGKLEWSHYVWGLIYQGAVFISTRWLVMKIFEENPGSPFYFSLLYVLNDYWSHPILTLGLLALLAPGVYFVALHWKEKPVFLRSALLIFFPVLLVVHLSMGMAFEIRVFAEVFPVAWALGLWRKL